MHEVPPAAVHVKRRLTDVERAVIAIGLELVSRLRADDALQDVRLAMMPDGEFPSDDQMRALAEEIRTAYTVKICRSKHTPL